MGEYLNKEWGNIFILRMKVKRNHNEILQILLYYICVCVCVCE